MPGLLDELSRHGILTLIGAVVGAVVAWFAARWKRRKERLSILRGDARDTVVIQLHIVTPTEIPNPNGGGVKTIPDTLRIRPLGQSELSRVVPNGHLAAELSRRAFRVTPHDTLISMAGAEGSFLLETLTNFVADRVGNAPFEHELYAMANFPRPELLAGRLLGGKRELPQNCVAVDNDTPLVPGTPVKYYFVRWTDGIVLEAPKEGGQVVIREGSFPFRKSVDRDALAISAETLKSLDEPSAAGKYAAAAKEARRATSHRFIHKYPAFAPVPQVAVRVTADTPLKEGVIVGLCLGRRWEEVEVLALNDDDSVHIRWKQRRTGLVEDVDRSDLIIAKKVLRTLKQHPAAAAAKGADEEAKAEGGL